MKKLSLILALLVLTSCGVKQTQNLLSSGNYDEAMKTIAEFDQQGIEMSLKSENLIVRIFAVLDRRVGKRRLALMKETIAEEPDTFREFYAIRMKAEGLI